MIPRPVAALPKELAPHHAAAAAAVAPATPFDFLQLLGATQVQQPQTTNTNSTTTSSQSTPPPASPAHKTKTEDADANVLAALAAQAQQPKLPPPPSQTAQPQVTAATALANAQGQAAAAPRAAQPLPGSAGNNQQNGQTTPLPPGAADVEARIVKGAAPTYLSQPSSVLAGLWHHPGEATPQTPQLPDDATSSRDAADAVSDSSGAQLQNAKAAALGAALAAAAPHSESAGASVAAVAPDAGQAAATSVTPDASALTTANLAAPTNTATAAAAPATPGAPMVVTPAQILPAYEQVAISLKQAAQTGAGRIEIQLKPASLGAISVKLDVNHDGHITAVISADRSDTLNLLRQDSAGLQQALRDAGLQADAGSLSFNLRGDAQSFAQNAPQTPAPSSGRIADATTAAFPDAPVARTRAHSGALDIEV
jgi:flagellar hook-length control protein FliK